MTATKDPRGKTTYSKIYTCKTQKGWSTYLMKESPPDRIPTRVAMSAMDLPTNNGSGAAEANGLRLIKRVDLEKL